MAKTHFMKYIFTLAILVCSFVSYSQKAGSGYVPVGYVDGKDNYVVSVYHDQDYGLFVISFEDSKKYIVKYKDASKNHSGSYVLTPGKLVLNSDDGVKREFKVIPIDGNSFKLVIGSKTVYYFRLTE